MVSCFVSLTGATSEDTAIAPIKAFLNMKFTLKSHRTLLKDGRMHALS